MHILYAANVRFPTSWAHGYQIAKTCEALAATGAQVDLVVTDLRDSSVVTSDPFAHYGVRPGAFPVHRLHVIDLSAHLSERWDLCTFLIRRWTYARSLRKYLRTVPCESVVYVRDVALARTLIKTGRKVYLEMHVETPPKVLRSLRGAAGIVCLTTFLAQRVTDVLPEMRVTVVPDAVDIALFDPPVTQQEARRRLGIAPDAIVVVYGGNFKTLGKSKGIGDLDRAVEELRPKFQKIRLYLVGGSQDDFDRVEGRPSSAATTCVPYGSREQLAVHYRAANLLVMPFPNEPHYAYAMSPLKMFEYMASKTAILTSDLPSVRDVLDERSAFFYDSRDTHGLYDALANALAVGEERRAAVAAEAWQRVKERYTWDARAHAVLSFLTGRIE